MEQVRIKRLALNDVVLGENLPFSFYGIHLYHVDRIFPFEKIMRLTFTPPDERRDDIWGALRMAHDNQDPICLSIRFTTTETVLVHHGYLIWCSWNSTAEGNNDAPQAFEIELATPLLT